MRPLFFAALLLMSSTASILAQPFPFSLPYDDATPTVIDNSLLNPAPLGEPSRLRILNGHFADQNGRRVRLLGTNFSGSANFPAPAESAKIAARLRKFGFNIVRLHHLDANWANPNIFGENVNTWSGSTQKLAPASLQKLDALVAELSKNGIYSNLNLHVARRLTRGDGFENTENLPEMGKVLAYFEPRFIQLQKDYARQILTRKNSVSGRLWAQDPALAVIELNNEDSLVGEAWSGVLQGLPQPYREQLRVRWNQYLKARFVSTEELKTRWGANSSEGDNLFSNPSFGAGELGWQIENIDGAKSSWSAQDAEANAPFSGRVARVQIEKLADVDWKIQFQQPGLNLQEGEFYTVSFWAKSEKNRRAFASFTLDQAPWSGVGGGQTLHLTPEWKRFRAIFKATGTVPDHVRFSMNLGGESGDISLADFSLQRGQILDLGPDASLENGTLDLPPGRAVTRALAIDWLTFLSSIEQNYVREMTDYIKKDLGYRGLVTCSQASYGGFAGVLRESNTDFIDMHAYWQHPEFPNRPWDPKDWKIGNTPMSEATEGGTLAGLAAHRVEGKPFTVSEYNHAAPNDFASETVVAILGYAGAQDWDGVYFFDYNSNGKNWNSNKIRGFFDMDSDPNKMAPLPVVARAFLRGEIAPHKAQTRLQIGTDLHAASKLTFGDAKFEFWNNVADKWRELGLQPEDAIQTQLALQFSRGEPQPKLLKNGGTTGDFAWKRNGEGGQFLVQADNVFAASGRLAQDEAWGQLGNGPRFSNLKSSNNFATLALGSRDGLPLEKSKSLLLTAINRAENQNMKWNATRTSVGDGWGNGPVMIEGVSGVLELKTGAKTAQVWALSPTGARVKKVPATLQAGVLKFRFAPADQTVWYEIALS